MLCDLGQFSQVLPLHEQIVALSVDVEARSVVVLRCHKHHGLLVIESAFQVNLRDRVILPQLHLSI